MWGCVGNPFHALFYASKWRKASQCKILIKKLQSTVKVQRRRRECMVKQSRGDITQLLCGGRLREALHRAEQICVDERRLSAYDQIESYCTCILQNYSHFQHQSDVHDFPNDMKEAIAGLIFAASRIGELLELQPIRYLFRQRFGFEFDKNNVGLSPENVVGSEIKRILETKPTMQSDVTTESLMEITQRSNQSNALDAPTNPVVSPLGDADDDQKVTKKINKLKMMVLRMKEKRKVTMMMKPKKENSKHVHPNLPECEDFEARVYGLRKEQQQKDLAQF